MGVRGHLLLLSQGPGSWKGSSQDCNWWCHNAPEVTFFAILLETHQTFFFFVLKKKKKKARELSRGLIESQRDTVISGKTVFNFSSTQVCTQQRSTHLLALLCNVCMSELRALN